MDVIDELTRLYGMASGVGEYRMGEWIRMNGSAYGGTPYHQMPDGTLLVDERLLVNMPTSSDPTYDRGRADGWQTHEPERIAERAGNLVLGVCGALAVVAGAMCIVFYGQTLGAWLLH